MIYNDVGNRFNSLFSYLNTKFTASGILSGGVSGTFMDAYPDEEFLKKIESITSNDPNDPSQIHLPIVTLEDGDVLDVIYTDIGSKNYVEPQSFLISVFAETKPQLRSLVGQIKHNLQGEVDLKDYNNNPPNITGKLFIENIKVFNVTSIAPARFTGYRGEVFFTVRS